MAIIKDIIQIEIESKDDKKQEEEESDDDPESDDNDTNNKWIKLKNYILNMMKNQD